MSRERCDNENSVVGTGTDRFVDAIAETGGIVSAPLGRHGTGPDTQGYPDLPGSCQVRCLRSRFGGAASTRTPERDQTEVGQKWWAGAHSE